MPDSEDTTETSTPTEKVDLDNYYNSVQSYVEKGEEAAREWLRTTGFQNIDELNQVLQQTATSWKERV